MVLSNVHIPGKEGLHEIHIGDDKKIIDCEGALAFRGLINSHDHLEFNLFPQLGNKVYKNYTEWGTDIHKVNEEEIRKIEQVPVDLRIQWGIYKNLLCGVTTVVNHGKKLDIDNELITVYQDSYCLHSPAFEKNWKWKLNSFKGIGKPVSMHMGEGTDEAARKEIDEVIRWNFFHRNIIGIHGVAMSAEQAKHLKALVWCPVSNEFLLGETARIDQLKRATTILFGTDSTLTASWNTWEHIRMARKLQLLTDEELLAALTTSAAPVWGLQQQDDWVIAKKKHDDTWASFFATNPEDILMVIHQGSIVLDNRIKSLERHLSILETAVKKYLPSFSLPFMA